MPHRAALPAFLLVGLLLGGPRPAGASEVAAVTLPSRSAGAAALAARVRRVGATLARTRGATLVDGPGTETSVSDVSVLLARAQDLAATGNLDEAARLLDDALEAGARAPHRFADSDALIAAHVTRAGIALARGEQARAAALLERLLRWDPTFELRAEEESPRLRAALGEARARTGERPALRAEDLGGLCGIDELLLARPLGPQRIEALRLERCRVVARVVVARVDDGVLALLDVAPPPAPPPRVLEARPAPVWERTWFWVGIGVVTTATAAIVWTVASSADEQVDVVPRF